MPGFYSVFIDSIVGGQFETTALPVGHTTRIYGAAAEKDKIAREQFKVAGNQRVRLQWLSAEKLRKIRVRMRQRKIEFGEAWRVVEDEEKAKTASPITGQEKRNERPTIGKNP